MHEGIEITFNVIDTEIFKHLNGPCFYLQAVKNRLSKELEINVTEIISFVPL